MPRTTQEISDHAARLAAERFENYEPRPGDMTEPESITALRKAVIDHANAELALREAVAGARADGRSWAVVAALLGTSAQSAWQRFGADSPPRP